MTYNRFRTMYREVEFREREIGHFSGHDKSVPRILYTNIFRVDGGGEPARNGIFERKTVVEFLNLNEIQN